MRGGAAHCGNACAPAGRPWDFCWNLDKDIEACALAAAVHAEEIKGFALKNGVPAPVNEAAWHKFATGVDDPYSKVNRLSYVEEIFQIVGIPFQREEYWLKAPGDSARKSGGPFCRVPGGSG